jgi:hypothetical protein
MGAIDILDLPDEIFVSRPFFYFYKNSLSAALFLSRLLA